MRIKLVQPRMTLRPMDTILKTRMAPSLALLTLATLTPPSTRLTIEDENVEDARFGDSPGSRGDHRQRGHVDPRLCDRRRLPCARDTGRGGRHPRERGPEEAGRYFDAVCVGPAEHVWATMLAEAPRPVRCEPVYRSDEACEVRPSPSSAATLCRKGTTSIRTSSAPAADARSSARSATTAAPTWTTPSSTGRWRRHRGDQEPAHAARHVHRRQLHRRSAWAGELLSAFRTLNLEWSAAVTTNIVKIRISWT